MIKNTKQIFDDVKKKIFSPVYLLHGDEPYFIDHVSDFIEQNVLSEAEKSFNLTIIYGKDAEFKMMLDTLMRYPMMSAYQVVILKEGQTFKSLEKLVSYFEKPLRSTIFVLCYKYKTLDKRSKLYKTLSSYCVELESKKLYDNQVPAFIEGLAREMQLKLSDESAAQLAEYLGTDLSKIKRELEKLSVNVSKSEQITPAHIEKYIGISKEFSVFEFLKAISRRDEGKIFQIAKYYEDNYDVGDWMKFTGTMYSFFSKALVMHLQNSNSEAIKKEFHLNFYTAEDMKNYHKNYRPEETVKIMNLLHEYDLKLKGVDYAGDKNALIKEFTFRILN